MVAVDGVLISPSGAVDFRPRAPGPVLLLLQVLPKGAKGVGRRQRRVSYSFYRESNVQFEVFEAVSEPDSVEEDDGIETHGLSVRAVALLNSGVEKECGDAGQP